MIFLCSQMCRDGEGVQISAVNMFSLSTNVTSTDVYNSLQMSLSNCSRTYSHCTIKLQHQLSYQGTIQRSLSASYCYLKSIPSVLILHSTPALQRYDNTSHAIHTDNTVLRGAVSFGLSNNILESSLWHCLSLGNHLF